MKALFVVGMLVLGTFQSVLSCGGCGGNPFAPPPPPKPPPKPAVRTVFASEETYFPVNECRTDRLSTLQALMPSFLQTMGSDGWTGTAVGQNTATRAFPHQWLDRNLHPAGEDEKWADNHHFAVYAGHGLNPYESYGGTVGIPHQTIAYSQSTTLNGWQSCLAPLSNVANEDEAFTYLGTGNGGKAATLMFVSCCTMQRQLIMDMVLDNRSSQGFGFEYTVFDTLDLGRAMPWFYQWSGAMGNVRAWHKAMTDIPGMGPSGKGGAIAYTMKDKSDRTPIDQYVAQQSLENGWWFDRLTTGTDHEVMIDRTELNCFSDPNCGVPLPGYEDPECQGYLRQFLEIDPFGVRPMRNRFPSSPREDDPVGTDVFRLGYSFLPVSTKSIADGAAIVASHALNAQVYADDLLPGLEENIRSGRFDMHRPFGNLAFAYEPERMSILMTVLDRNHYDPSGEDAPFEYPTLSPEGFARRIEEYGAFLGLSGLPAIEYYSIKRPTGNLSVRTRFSTEDGEVASVGETELNTVDYKVYREVNGVPFIDSSVGLSLDKHGNLVTVGVSGYVVDLAGNPGEEVASGSTVVVPRLISKEKLDEIVAKDVLEEFGESVEVNFSWTSFVYAIPPGGGAYAEPYQIYEFSLAYPDGVRSRRQRWGYRVDQESPERVVF